MRTRIVIGAGAWVLGAAAATAGSLLVVNELGESISASPGSQQSTAAALSQAQAGQAAAQPSSPPAMESQGGTGGTSGASGSGGANSAGTILTSSGGTVMARCEPAGAFLQSWSPQVGFQENSVARGPATAARVVFTSGATTVTMVVSCGSGAPTAATTVTNAPAPAPSSTGDDNGGGGNKGPGGGGGGGGDE